MKSRLNTFDNRWYKPGSYSKRVVWFFVNSLFFKSSCFSSNRLKILLLKLFGASVGNGVVIKPNVNIKYPWFLRIGDYSWIGEDVWIDNLAKVEIGSHVCISQGAFLLCGNHDYTKPSFDLMVKPIIIEDGVWVGAKSVVCPGVTCFSHAVLSVGSIATKNLEAYSIYQGNPAQKIKERRITD